MPLASTLNVTLLPIVARSDTGWEVMVGGGGEALTFGWLVVVALFPLASVITQVYMPVVGEIFLI